MDPRAELSEGALLLGYMARWYPHKNHNFLTRLRTELLSHGLDVRFAVTLSDEEWAATSKDFRAACVNVGVLNITQVAAFNQACDAMVFPSLLESFSATPLEALVCNGILFASDRDFVKESCGNYPIYIDPLDAASSAETVALSLQDPETWRLRRERSNEIAIRLPDAEDRARTYMSLIDSILKEREAFRSVE